MIVLGLYKQRYVRKQVNLIRAVLILFRVVRSAGLGRPVGWPNIFKSCGSSDYFNSWRFGGIVDDIDKLGTIPALAGLR